MCRLVLYLGPPIPVASLVTDPSHSLIHQSRSSEERSEPMNGDGFGVAWYAPEVSEEPAVFRSVYPAWNDANLHELARVVVSPGVLAHVRAATGGEVSLANCHPFRWGRLAFAHNGVIGGFGQVRRRLLAGLSERSFHAIRGTTDSEHLFGLLLDELDAVRAEGAAGVEALAEGVRRTIVRVLALLAEIGCARPSALNLVLTDGASAVATRYSTGVFASGESLYVNQGRDYVCEGGVCRMVAAPRAGGTVLIASEPLSEESGWEPVPPASIVLAEGGRAEVRPLEL